jgi:LuxR family maltose regulon positive regulatory protein
MARQSLVAGGTTARSGLLAARVAIPEQPAGMVSRPQLSDAVARAALRRLTVVSAGPGWGKTSAVSAWASAPEHDATVAWLSVESGDDSLAAFWRATLRALRSTGSIPAGHPLAVVGPTNEMSPETMQATYRGLLALPAPIVLVLDDFHVIQDQSVLESLAVLLSHDLPLRLIIVTRTDPVLPLHRLRLSGELCEITADDLAFSSGELAVLSQMLGLELHRADLDRIQERTDGWPAGVRLAMLHLSRPGAARDLSGFGGSNRSIGEYFVAEVLNQQTPQVREFLIRTSVADRICAELADAIVPGGLGGEHLEELERSHQFVTALGPEREWYQYHPLLRELLEHTLARDDPDQFRADHAAAAGWLARHEEPVAALRHAAGAEDWTLFCEVFVQAAVLSILGPDRPVVERLLSAVPYGQLTPTAPLAICGWASAFLQGRFAAMSTYTEAARDLLTSTTPAALLPATSAIVEMIACSTARTRSDAATVVTTATTVLTQLDRVSRPFPALPGLRAVAANNLGVGLLWSGRPDEAANVLLPTTSHLEEAGIHLTTMNAWAHLALCGLVGGRLDEAERYAATALSLAEPRGVTSRFELRNAHITKAFVALLHGDTDEADRSVAAALAGTDGADEPAATTAARVCQALVAVSRGRSRAAEHALTAAAAAAASWLPPAFLQDWRTRATTEALLLAPVPGELADGIVTLGPAADLSATGRACLARLLLAAGDLTAAEQVAAGACQLAADDVVDPVTEIEAWLVRALVGDQRRRAHDAQECLRRALVVAGPQRLLRPFLVSGSERLPKLLQQLVEVDPALGWIGHEILARSGALAPRTSEPEPLTDALTDRELTVLWALPTLQTNAEIAADLFISVNTVKAHLKALNRKLGVANRREAVRRGRALGILP